MKLAWASLEEGALVVGNDGETWMITSRSGGDVTVERDGRPPYTFKPSGLVEVVDSHALAVALLEVRLGAQVVAQRGTSERPWLTPVTFSDPGSLLAHMYLLHGVKGDGESTLSDLTKAHELLHKNKDDLYEPHHHDPDFRKAG